MLLATVLASILMGGILMAAATLSRDRVRMEARQGAGRGSGAFEMIRRDLTNGVALVASADASGFEVIGFGGIDAKTFLPNQRLVRVRYHIVRDARGGMLVRDQAYLDDPVRVDRWSDVVAIGAGRVSLMPLSNDGEVVKLGDEVGERLRAIDRGAAVPLARRVPSRVRVRIEYASGAEDCDMVLR
jgi:hypothetical protein